MKPTRNLKIKIIESKYDWEFVKQVNEFVEKVLVIDIKDQTYSYATGGSTPTVVNRVLIYYKDKG